MKVELLLKEKELLLMKIKLLLMRTVMTRGTTGDLYIGITRSASVKRKALNRRTIRSP